MRIKAKTITVELTAKDLKALVEYYDNEYSVCSKANMPTMARCAALRMQQFAITKSHLEDGRYDIYTA